MADDNHRKAGAKRLFGDILANRPGRQAKVVRFLESIDAKTRVRSDFRLRNACRAAQRDARS